MVGVAGVSEGRMCLVLRSHARTSNACGTAQQSIARARSPGLMHRFGFSVMSEFLCRLEVCAIGSKGMCSKAL